MTPRNSPARLVLQPVGVLAVAALVGVVVGWLGLMAFSAGADPGNGWADLAAAVTGMLAGAAAGLVVWVVGLVWLSRRLFPRGGRAGAVALAVLAVTLLGTLLMATGDVWAGSDLRELAGLLLWLSALGAPSIVFLLWDRRTAATPLLGPAPVPPSGTP